MRSKHKNGSIPRKLCAPISPCLKTKVVHSGTGKLLSSCAPQLSLRRQLGQERASSLAKRRAITIQTIRLRFWSPSPTPPAPLNSHAPDLRTAHPDRGPQNSLILSRCGLRENT